MDDLPKTPDEIRDYYDRHLNMTMLELAQLVSKPYAYVKRILQSRD